MAYAAKNDQELQERGKKIHEYIKAYEQKHVKQKECAEEVTKKIELPDMPKRSGYGIMEKKTEPAKYAEYDTYLPDMNEIF